MTVIFKPTGDRLFDKQLAVTFHFEGGGLNDSRATTGELSKYGIALASHPNMTADEIINLTADQAVALYKSEIWDHIGFNRWPEMNAGKCFDLCVNPGYGHGLQVLLAALAVSAAPRPLPPIVGWRDPAMLRWVNRVGPYKLLTEIRVALAAYYTQRIADGFLPSGYLPSLLRRAAS